MRMMLVQKIAALEIVSRQGGEELKQNSIFLNEVTFTLRESSLFHLSETNLLNHYLNFP